MKNTGEGRKARRKWRRREEIKKGRRKTVGLRTKVEGEQKLKVNTESAERRAGNEQGWHSKHGARSRAYEGELASSSN